MHCERPAGLLGCQINLTKRLASCTLVPTSTCHDWYKPKLIKVVATSRLKSSGEEEEEEVQVHAHPHVHTVYARPAASSRNEPTTDLARKVQVHAQPSGHGEAPPTTNCC